MNQDDRIVAKLDTLTRLVAIGLCGDKSQREKIEMLARAGLQPKDIADLLGTTPNTVSVSLSNMRKRDGKTKSRRVQEKEGVNE